MPPQILPESEDEESTPSTSIPSHPKLRRRGTAQKAPRKAPTKKRTKASVPKKHHSAKPIKVASKKRRISQSSKCVYHNVYHNFNLLCSACSSGNPAIPTNYRAYFPKKKLYSCCSRNSSYIYQRRLFVPYSKCCTRSTSRGCRGIYYISV